MQVAYVSSYTSSPIEPQGTDKSSLSETISLRVILIYEYALWQKRLLVIADGRISYGGHVFLFLFFLAGLLVLLSNVQ